MKKIFVEGRFDVVASATQKMLQAGIDLVAIVEVPDDDHGETTFFSMIDTEFRLQAAKAFIAMLRTDTDLKRRIGGTKWSVKIPGDVREFPFFLEREHVGNIKKFIDVRNAYKIMDQIVSRNQHLYAELFAAKAEHVA